MAKKYLMLVEDYMKRFERGGFLVGDIFEFNKNFKTEDEYKSLGQNVKDMIDEMLDSGLNIRVVGIKDNTGARFPGSNQSSSNDVELSLALDNTGGRFTHYVSVSPSLGQPGDSGYPGLTPIPDEVKRKDKVNIKPKEMEKSNNNSNKSDRGDGKLSDTERTLTRKNTVLPHKSTSPSPAVASQTHHYLKDLAKA